MVIYLGDNLPWGMPNQVLSHPVLAHKASPSAFHACTQHLSCVFLPTLACDSSRLTPLALSASCSPLGHAQSGPIPPGPGPQSVALCLPRLHSAPKLCLFAYLGL